MNPKLYLESTIPSYLTARPGRDLIVAAHQQITQEWWASRRTKFDIYVSQFVLDEVALGDLQLAEKRLEVVGSFPQLEITEDVTRLAEHLIASGVVPDKAPIDAAHVAVSAVHAMDYLMTWNCRHLANAEISLRVRRACAAQGYECPIMCTPEELMGGE